MAEQTKALAVCLQEHGVHYQGLIKPVLLVNNTKETESILLPKIAYIRKRRMYKYVYLYGHIQYVRIKICINKQ